MSPASASQVPNDQPDRPERIKWRRAWFVVPAVLFLVQCAVRENLANAAMRQNPELAVRISPANGEAIDRAAAVRFVRAQEAAAAARSANSPGAAASLSVDVNPQLASAARKALMHEPFALSSIALLSRAARQNGRSEEADRLLGHAGMLSRRDATTQLLLIEQAARRGDAQDLVRHIDIAMRTRKDGYEVMFPALAQQLRNPELAGPMMRVAREDPEWFHLFLGEAVREPSALDAVERFMRAFPRSRFGSDRQLRINLMNQLVASGRQAAARSYFVSLHGPAQTLLRDPQFRSPELEEPFGWTLRQEAGLGAEFTSDEGLSLFAGQGRSGVVATQLIDLAPGSYAIRLDAPATGLSMLGVQITCQASGRRLVLASQGRAGEWQLAVPQGCAQQTIGITAGNAGDPAGSRASLRGISIKPV